MAGDPTVAAAAQKIIDRVNAEFGEVFARSDVELNGDKDPGNRTEETNLGDLHHRRDALVAHRAEPRQHHRG